MQERSAYPELKELVVEASRALASLDANRLEELALSCQELNRELATDCAGLLPGLGPQAQAAAADMAVLAGVLEATQANLQVMRRLRELRQGRREYSEAQAQGWGQKETMHGDN